MREVLKGSNQILKELWSKEENVPEFTTSYQYVLEHRKRFDETMKLARTLFEKNQIRNKKCAEAHLTVRPTKWCLA